MSRQYMFTQSLFTLSKTGPGRLATLLSGLALMAVLGACSDPAPVEPAQATRAMATQTAPTPPTTRLELLANVALEPQPEALKASAPASILILGDSISAAYGIQREQGWVALLDDTLKPLAGEHRVINASISGDTTGGGAARLPAALTQHQPDLVIIELGGNDGLRGYPVPRLRENLSTMIEASMAADAQVLLVGMQIPPNYGPRYTRAFANTFTELAAEYDIALVPGFLEQVALAGGLMQADGIHPTAAAQPLLLQAIWPAIADFLQTHQG